MPVAAAAAEEAAAALQKASPPATSGRAPAVIPAIPAKAAMAAMGLIENELRLPLVPAQQKTYDLMAATVRNLGLL